MMTRPEPLEIVAGDSADWLVSLPHFPAGSGWSLTYVVKGPAHAYTVSAVAEGDSHRVTLAPATTAAWAPGSYTLTALVSNGAIRATVRSVGVTVYPDPATSLPSDRRSFAVRMLEAIEVALLGHGTAGQLDMLSVTFAEHGKQVNRSTLLIMRDKFRAEVAQERAAAAMAAGMGAAPGRVRVRF